MWSNWFATKVRVEGKSQEHEVEGKWGCQEWERLGRGGTDRMGAVNFLRGVSFLAPFLLVSLLYVDEPLLSAAAFCLLSSDYHIRDMELHKKPKRKCKCPDSVPTSPSTGYFSTLINLLPPCFLDNGR